MKHTPGPWEVRNDREFYTNHAQPYCIAQVSEDEDYEGKWICRCMDSWDKEMQYNARLIAAAPELLVAAKGALAALTQNKTFPADIAAAKSFLQTAIAKAEGK